MQLPDIVQPLAENHVCELESFSDVFLPATTDVPFSAMDMSTPIRVGLPPRIVGKHLLEQMNAHDFVGYVPNPYWRRGSSQGSASRAVAGIRNLRQTPKVWSSSQLDVFSLFNSLSSGDLRLRLDYNLTWYSGMCQLLSTRLVVASS